MNTVLGIQIVENAALNGADVLVVHQGRAWLCHGGVWSEIPAYAERATALLDSLMESIPKYPAYPAQS